MTTYTFTVPGIPVAKGRPRAVKTNAGHIRVYTPDATANFEARVRAAAQQAGVRVQEGPISLTVLATWPTRGAPRKRDPRKSEWKTTRPDADNVAKAVLDSMAGVAWIDDSQVVHLIVEKWHAAQGEPPCVLVTIATL